jgi:hypothetical protein
MPITSVPKTSGTRMHLIIFRKTLETILSSIAWAGKKWPKATPAIMEKMIHWGEGDPPEHGPHGREAWGTVTRGRNALVRGTLLKS